MKRLFFFLTLGCLFSSLTGLAQRVTLRSASASPQATYAVNVLKQALLAKGYSIVEKNPEFTVTYRIDSTRLKPEAYAVQPRGKTILLEGGDGRGLVYATYHLTEAIASGTALATVKATREEPQLPFRAIKFNLPWDTYRRSSALDQHKETCRDLRFWEAFLDMMARNRFNALTLWNLHPFPFMIRPTNFPEASPFTDKELAEWQALYRGIFRMAKERGIDTYLVNWNIYVTPEFAKAHQVALDNLEHKIHARGDTSDVVKRYTRECVTQVLNEYPDLSGFSFTHGEAMWGMTPQQRQDWFNETILEGMRLANRKAKLIHRVPLSANQALGGSTSVDTEVLTRKAMEKLDFLEGPVWVEIKFNWSHAYSSPKLIKVHGGKLSDTYFKPEPQNYKIAWMARNEDFFCLRWGVPSFIREHIRTNSASYVGGYFVGSECYIPAKDYFTKPGAAVNWKYAFERQWLFYKLWGRLLYNPATPDEVFKSEFTRRYGPSAGGLLDAHALAGTVPLRLGSSFDFTWDFTLYSEGMMALDSKKQVSYISVDRQISQPTTDPGYLSVRQYVGALASGSPIDPTKLTPLKLADLLEQDCRKALELVKSLNMDRNSPLVYEVADIKAWANLGLSFAQKLRGAVALQSYRMKGEAAQKEAAVKHLEKALAYWDEVIAVTRPLYREMPLVHFSESNDALRFHWENVRPSVAADIEIARKAVVTTTGAND